MSQETEKTPITDQQERKPYFSPSEWIELTKRIEQAANALADELKWRMQQLDIVCGGEPCESEALAAFAALRKEER